MGASGGPISVPGTVFHFVINPHDWEAWAGATGLRTTLTLVVSFTVGLLGAWWVWQELRRQ